MSRWPGDATRERTTFGGLNRSSLMSRIRGKGNRTTEERLVNALRRLCVAGWRRHLDLPGKPDFAWPREKVAVFVDGCFWHGHDCGRNLTPNTNKQAWLRKIRVNRGRDRRNARNLRDHGWSVIRIWECRLKRDPNACVARIARVLSQRCP